MNQYKVILSDKVQKSIKKVSDDYLIRIHKELSLLSLNPRPFGYIKLSGFSNLYRIRVGVYRIIYTINDDVLTVEVVKIDHRGSIYK